MLAKNAYQSPRSLPSRFSAVLAGLLCSGILMTISGCAVFHPAVDPATIPAAPETKPIAGLYQVEMQTTFGKGKVYQGEIDGPITVQTVLERSGAIEKFRGMDIVLMRVVKESGVGLKMPVDYEIGDKSVRPEHDYAIHPNDRIIISSRSNNPLDKFVDAMGATH